MLLMDAGRLKANPVPIQLPIGAENDSRHNSLCKNIYYIDDWVQSEEKDIRMILKIWLMNIEPGCWK